MKNFRLKLYVTAVLICTCMLSGCWNYREIEQLSIVSGVAIDKTEEGKVLLTVETVKVSQNQRQSALQPVYVQSSGSTFFDAVRKMAAIQGKKLYWSHAKVIIISEAVAKDDISRFLDFMNRDPEVREDMWIMISRENTANKIFYAKPESESILSFQLDYALRGQKFITRYAAIALYDFLDMLATEETSAIVPAIRLINNRGKTDTYMSGTAVIKKNKLLDYLNEQESRALLWIRDELEQGLFIVEKVGNTDTNVSMEIFKSKTRLEPAVKDGKLFMKVEVKIDMNIGEIMGTDDFISEEGRALLKNEAEIQIEKHLYNLIRKAQKEYKADFLGFAKKIKHSMPGIWKSIEKEWEKFFTDMEYSVDVSVRIRGSGNTRAPIKVEK